MPAFADEATIRKVLEAKLGGAKIEGVQRGPLGLCEVRFRADDGVHIVYTDAAARTSSSARSTRPRPTGPHRRRACAS
jgi:hypothetical protein